MIDLSKNQRSINTSGAHVDGGDVEALRAQFEREIGEAAPFPVQRYGDSYAHRICAWAWEGYQAGHAAAKAETAAAVAKERERASVLYDMLLNRPALNAGLESEYAAWTSKCYQVTGAYKAAIRAGAKEPSDA